MEIIDYKCVYFTFGRFQPPTTGHAENFKAVKNTAKGCDWFIYLSQSVDSKGSNPLDPDRKLYYAKKMFPSYAKHLDQVLKILLLYYQSYNQKDMMIVCLL